MEDVPYTEEEILKEIDRLYKEVIQLTVYEPSKEDLTKSIIQTIKEFEEGRIILSSTPKELKTEDFEVENLQSISQHI